LSRESAIASVATSATPATPSPESQDPSLSNGITNSEPTENVTPSEGLQSSAFSQMAKKEAEFVRRQEEFKRERESVLAEKEKIKSIQSEYEEFVSLKSKDPIAAMKKLGFSEADIINYLAGEEPEELSPEAKMQKAAEEAAEKRFKEYEDAQTKKALEVQAQANERTISEFKGQISQSLEQNAEKYKFCAHHGEEAQDLIFGIIEEAAIQSEFKEALTIEEASELLEGYYVEKFESMAALRAPAPVPDQAPPVTPPAQQRPLSAPEGPPRSANPPTRTLTNSATASLASTKPRAPETRSEKRERLMQALRNGGL